MKPTPHPKPWQSRLWPHVDLIRRRRLARATWAAIAEELRALGVAISPQAIGRFFKRSRKGKLPLGLEQVDRPRVNPPERAPDGPKQITAAELLPETGCGHVGVRMTVLNNEETSGFVSGMP